MLKMPVLVLSFHATLTSEQQELILQHGKFITQRKWRLGNRLHHKEKK